MMDEKMRLNELAQGFRHSAILLTACDLGIFAELGHERLEAQELARRLGLDARALEIVLLALAADEILTLEAGRFAIAPGYAPLLLPNSPQTMINILNHNFHIMLHWVRLAETLRTGQPIPRQESANPERAMRAFICGMADISRASSLDVAEKFDLSPYRRMLDLGGGPATHSITFARKNPDLTSVVFDLEGPLTIAREEIEKAGLADRITTQAGDLYTDDYGEGFDLVYVSNIIHMMGPEETALLARKSRQALVPGGTLVIKEFFLDNDRIHPPEAALFSVNMLVNTEAGKSYTVSETKEILTEAGFGQFREIPVAMASRLLIAQAD